MEIYPQKIAQSHANTISNIYEERLNTSDVSGYKIDPTQNQQQESSENRGLYTLMQYTAEQNEHIKKITKNVLQFTKFNEITKLTLSYDDKKFNDKHKAFLNLLLFLKESSGKVKFNNAEQFVRLISS